LEIITNRKQKLSNVNKNLKAKLSGRRIDFVCGFKRPIILSDEGIFMSRIIKLIIKELNIKADNNILNL